MRGTVQGVGFRPFIYRLATHYGLRGWVRNDADGVLIEVEGEHLEGFLRALRAEPPQHARIDAVEITAIPRAGDRGFHVAASVAGKAATAIAPDYPICPQCLAELFDATDRRHLHPFIQCTACGPRYTLTRRLPYDRANTSMAGFELCAACAREYHDPADRRFHAEAIACAACGPRLALPVAAAVARIRAGGIVAIKGLGGFHLACDARNERAVARLRARKHRDEKPLALMAANLASVRCFARCGRTAAALIESPARPIVLLRRRAGRLAANLAPGMAWLGFMLPYTPLHFLLFHEAADRPAGHAWLAETQDLVLVMTSANPGGEPLVIDNDEAVLRLSGIADTILAHDRAIVVRADDSVLRVVAGRALFVRRARGFVPEPIKLARVLPPGLAVGGHLNNTVCVTRGREAFVSQHLGDLDNVEARRFFEDTIAHLLEVLDVRPEFVAHDLHPDFHGTRFAHASGLPAIAVQHHHAHVAAVAAEHRARGPYLGVALDGFGLGADGGAWGGELLWVEGACWERLGHLAVLPQPGGDRATREPWRMAAAALHALGRGDEIATRFAGRRGSGALASLLAKGLGAPGTSSCGRWFDAACGLLGVLEVASFEAQAPMRIEGLVRRPRAFAHGWRIENGVLDLLPLLARLVDCAPQEGAERFHGTLVAALADWVSRAARATGCRTVVLAGGCLLNHYLARDLPRALRKHRLRALLPRRLPPNDGAISLGQAWIAAELLAAGRGGAPNRVAAPGG